MASTHLPIHPSYTENCTLHSKHVVFGHLDLRRWWCEHAEQSSALHYQVTSCRVMPHVIMLAVYSYDTCTQLMQDLLSSCCCYQDNPTMPLSATNHHAKGSLPPPPVSLRPTMPPRMAINQCDPRVLSILSSCHPTLGAERHCSPFICEQQINKHRVRIYFMCPPLENPGDETNNTNLPPRPVLLSTTCIKKR